MATVPLSGTNVRLLKGIPFNNDYKNTRWFDNLSSQTAYFLNKTVVYSYQQMNFLRIEGKNYIRVPQQIDDLWNVNYIMFQNETFSSKWFYGFVTKLEYVNRNVTEVYFEIDVFQTWLFDMNFKPSFVSREHCKLWNSDGSPVINTVDEGLNYGTDYDVVKTKQHVPNEGVLFLVIVAKSTLHVPIGSTNANLIMPNMNGSIQPLSFYIHPFQLTGGSPEVVIEGDTHVISDVKKLLNEIYKNQSAINNIVSLYVTDHVGIKTTFNGSVLSLNTTVYQQLEWVNLVDTSTTTIYVKDLITYETTKIVTGGKYDNIGKPTESKLLMYPYTVTVMDDFKGNRKVLKNEYINGDSLDVEVMGSLGVSNKVAYLPTNYLTGNVSDSDKKKIGLENALIDSTPHDVSIINDMLSAFLQGNRNSLINQVNSIAFNGVLDVIGGGIGGAASAAQGNVGGVVGSGLNIVRGAGNSLLKIEGINAKLKDINNIPPNLSKMGSNTAFEYGNTYYGFWLITKQIKPEYKKKLSDFFGMYGYKVNEVKIPNFHTRQNWNFVQTVNSNILGNINNNDLQELKNIFDNGITLWHTDDIGNYSLSNGVI